MTEPLLAIDDLQVAYHRVAVALHGISLRVMPQTIVALVGNNGAGKTTTLRAISGFIGLDDARVTAGSIRFAGQRDREPAAARQHGARHRAGAGARQGLSEPHGRREPDRRSLAPRQRGRAAPSRSAGVPVLPGAGAAAARGSPDCCPAANARCWRSAAPSSASPNCCWWTSCRSALRRSWSRIWRGAIASIRQELGITVLLVEQNVGVALGIADYGYVLENGRVALEGAAAELRGRREIQQSYLGQASGEERRSYRALRHAPPGASAWLSLRSSTCRCGSAA